MIHVPDHYVMMRLIMLQIFHTFQTNNKEICMRSSKILGFNSFDKNSTIDTRLLATCSLYF